MELNKNGMCQLKNICKLDKKCHIILDLQKMIMDNLDKYN